MQKEGCDLAPVLSLQQKKILIGMPTHFAATYLFSAFPPTTMSYGLSAPQN